MNSPLTRVQIVLYTVLSISVIAVGVFVVGRDRTKLAGVVASKCALQSEIDERIALKAKIDSDIIVAKSAKAAVLEKISKNQLFPHTVL